jgi:hypothetical protein
MFWGQRINLSESTEIVVDILISFSDALGSLLFFLFSSIFVFLARHHTDISELFPHSHRILLKLLVDAH